MLVPLLKSVSRSFHLSLRLLPDEVRDPLSVSYLLARTTDTIADAATADVETREQALEDFTVALRAGRLSAAAEARIRALADDGDPARSAGETELLERVAEVLAWFAQQPDEVKPLIINMMQHVASGQRDDLRRTVVTSDAELDHYTFQVAGSVGEFWTRLCFKRLDFFSEEPEERLVELGIRYGKGLQLVNILRDVPKDRTLGRCYLPGLPPGATPEALLAVSRPWRETCRLHLEAGQAWVEAVRGFRCRLAALLPLRLARATLECLESAGPAAMTQPVKVTRARLRLIALRAMLEAAAG